MSELSVDSDIVNYVESFTDAAVSHLCGVSANRMVARGLVRASLALLGDKVERESLTDDDFEDLDEIDFEELIINLKSIFRKVKISFIENEKVSALNYLRAALRLLGNGSSSRGCLTPRPRDYTAAIRRFSDDDLSSPIHQENHPHMCGGKMSGI